MKFKNLLTLTFLILQFSPLPAVAKMGSESIGGGGDASEARVNEIRSDVLKWIEEKGALGLVLPSNMTYDEYVSNMSIVLQPKKVIIGFTEERVIYNNTEKTCKSFIDKDNYEMQILCNISRFEETKNSDQYKLIHHEYAGLARIEKNDGAASDYNISSQITDYLEYKKILKLAIKKDFRKDCTINLEMFTDIEQTSQEVITVFKRKDFIIAPKEKSKYSIDKLKIDCVNIQRQESLTGPGAPERISCDEVFAGLTIKNNLTGESLDILGYVLKSDTIEPTPQNALMNLINNIPKCND